MNKKELPTNITTRKGAIPSKNQDKVPVTLSEKLALLEKKFATVVGEVAQLNTEINVTKGELADAIKEIAETKKENAALLAQLVVCDQEIKNFRAELCDLKKNFSTKNVNTTGGNTAGADNVTAAIFHRTVFRKLPCKSIDELKLMKEDMDDMDTLIYIENRLSRIGGSDLKSCITGILDRLLSKELQANICLTGKRTQKSGLMEFPEIMDLIHNAVRYSFSNYRDKDGESIIGKILQK